MLNGKSALSFMPTVEKSGQAQGNNVFLYFFFDYLQQQLGKFSR
jgi:hypothetical protein